MLEVLVTSRVRRKVLLDFARHDGRVTVATLAARIKEDPGNLSRELRALETAGFLRSVAGPGRQKLYYASPRKSAQKLLNFLREI
jgi:DNA-binding MarR family transcriptional regulator